MKKELNRTEIGKIPKDWQTIELVKVLNVIKNGLTKTQNKNKMGYPITRIETIADEKINIEKIGFVTNVTQEEIGDYQLVDDDILFSHINSLIHVGKTAIYEGKPPFLLHGMNLLLLRPEKKCVWPSFLLRILRYLRAKDRFKNMAKKAVNQASINQTELGKLTIPLPSLPEQRKIAEILSTVDEAIENVDKAIDKTERLQKGLMQELLTKGIGHIEFKDTEIGRIPKEWEVKRLGNVVEINKEAKDLPKDYPNSKFLYIDIDSVENGSGNIKQIKEIVGKDAPSRARRVVHQNDVIMSTVRPYLKAFALIPKEYDNQICSTGFAVLTSKDNLIPHYLLYTLFSKIVLDQCNKMMVGGQYPALNSQQVSQIVISVPQAFEQKRIAGILGDMDKRLELFKRKKRKFEKIKKELMNDLLSGKRRV